MPRCKKRKHSESLLSCLDQTSLAVVHRLSNKLLGPSEKKSLPSMTTLKRMSWSILNTIGTDIDVPLVAGGSRTITVVRPQEAIVYMIQHVECFRTMIEATFEKFSMHTVDSMDFRVP